MRFMAKNIAMIGDRESVKGFAAIGMDVFVCEEPAQAAQLLKTVAESERFAIIYMTEELFSACAHEREKFTEVASLAIIPLPGVRGNTGIGLKRQSQFVEQAVGSDILFKN